VTRRQRLQLVHDVGKYVARTARNLPPAPQAPTAEMVDMLARDLYALRPGQRASAVLAALAGDADEPAVADARALLAEADALEPRVRAAEPAAVVRVAALALAVEARLRQLLEPT
jgi:hypothetical protein